MNELAELTMRFAKAKRALREVEAEIAETQDALMELLPEAKVIVETDIGRIQITKVAPERTTWVAEKVKAALSPANWRKVRIEIVDRAKLDAFIAAGEIPMPDDCQEITPLRPYLRLTERPTPSNSR